MEKALFQINYNSEEDSYKFVLNEMDNKEFFAFLCFLKMCVRKFEDDSYYTFLGDDEDD